MSRLNKFHKAGNFVSGTQCLNPHVTSRYTKYVHVTPETCITNITPYGFRAAPNAVSIGF